VISIKPIHPFKAEMKLLNELASVFRVHSLIPFYLSDSV